MSEQKRLPDSESNTAKTGDANNGIATSQPRSDEVAISESKTTKELTPEEQMALFEKDLKENDWGHQPC
jgi:hypothetical protein